MDAGLALAGAALQQRIDRECARACRRLLADIGPSIGACRSLPVPRGSPVIFQRRPDAGRRRGATRSRASRRRSPAALRTASRIRRTPWPAGVPRRRLPRNRRQFGDGTRSSRSAAARLRRALQNPLHGASTNARWTVRLAVAARPSTVTISWPSIRGRTRHEPGEHAVEQCGTTRTPRSQADRVARAARAV